MSREDQIAYMILNCRIKEITQNILLPATDFVMHSVKKHFKNVETHGKVLKGNYGGATVSLVTSGIGAPATAMTMEALRAARVKQIIRVDYCGALTDNIEIGDIIVCSGAICGDGTTPHYLNPDTPFPRVPADSILSSKIKEGFEMKKKRFHYGTVWTHDALFKESSDLIQKAKSYDTIAIDMETSAIFAIGKLYGISTAAILIVTDQPCGKDFLSENINITPRILQNLDDSIDIALGVLSLAKPEEQKKMGLTWNPNTKQFFEELILSIPSRFQSMAKLGISSLAEENARKRSSDTVEDPDMVQAFLDGTPRPVQGAMRESLKKHGTQIQDS